MLRNGPDWSQTRQVPEMFARSLWSSSVVRAELLAGMRAVEEAATRELLRLITWVDVDEPMSEAACALRRRSYLFSHPGIEVANFIVAAPLTSLTRS